MSTGPTPVATAPRRQVVTFALGDDLFAADVFEVERVLRHRDPTPVPELPRWVAGLVDHGGRPLPVIDLRARFELPPAGAEVERRILVAAAGESRVGMVVDRVLEVRTVSADRWEAPPPLFRGLARELLHGTFSDGGRIVMVLDVARLVTATERLVLERMIG